MTLDEKVEFEQKEEAKKLHKAFMQATKSSEILIVILKAHLYMEQELIRSLTDTLLDEKILSGTTFRQKLDLARSIGVIDDIYGALGKVNSIRNSYAHSIDYSFDEKIFEDLLSTLSKADKDDFLSDYEEMKLLFFDGTIPELNFKLQVLLGNIWFSLLSCRHFAKKGIELRLKEKEIETKAKYITDDKTARTE